MPSLLVFSRDPGPTNQLVAAVEMLRCPPAVHEPGGLAALRDATRPVIGDVRIVARSPGDAIWRAAGYAPAAWAGADDADAGKLIEVAGAQIVLTGADDIDELADRALWRAARTRGIASHALLDHPANLAQRFDDGEGRRTYPDWLYVSDEIFKSRLVSAGAPAERIRIIGDLHHARLASLAKSRSAPELAALRQAWGAGRDDVVILFASECAREMTARGRPSPYDEIEVFSRLLKMVASGERPGGGRVDPARTLVVLRPHPRDTSGKYDALLARHGHKPRVIVSAAGSPDSVLLAADLIAGMNSSLLYEAVALGRAAISLTGHDLSAGKSAAG